MPKETFDNLRPEKKEKVLKVLKALYQEKPFQEVTVKEIVEELGIARGSFYQYFEDLEDAYFTVLNSEAADIHRLFMKLLKERSGDLEEALFEYGDMLSKILFDKEAYPIYKNRYLYWNESPDQRWNKEYRDQIGIFTESEGHNTLDIEKIHYLKGIVHMLIKRNFQENWSKKEFKDKFKLRVT